jgi:hypothetical protein
VAEGKYNMTTVSEDGHWIYMEDQDPAILPSLRHICVRCGTVFPKDASVMGLLKIHDEWHKSLETR